MSRYIAKRVALNTMKECKQPGCGCFTQKGYYIQYQNGNVDSMLFVCESCYDEKFREKCYAGDFDEERYIVKENTSRYQPINLLLRYLIRWTRKTAKTARPERRMPSSSVRERNMALRSGGRIRILNHIQTRLSGTTFR